MNQRYIEEAKREIDWQEIALKYEKMLMKPDKLKPGDYCRVVNLTTNEYCNGTIVFETDSWREIEVEGNYKIFSFYNHKFTKYAE